MDVAVEDRVRRRAYEIWESEGRPSGRSLAHWDQALSEIAAPPATPVRAKKAKKVTGTGIAEVVMAGPAKQTKRRAAGPVLN